jgi:GTPase SAR1 family protein/uncharacterized protein YukE
MITQAMTSPAANEEVVVGNSSRGVSRRQEPPGDSSPPPSREVHPPRPQSASRKTEPGDPGDSNTLDGLFVRASKWSETFGLNEFPAVRRLAELHRRLSLDRFHLAVLGQFKRGKSTFLNALLGEDVLPTAVLPVTAIPIFISHGVSPRLRIAYSDGRPVEEITAELGEDLRARLFEVATEEANPQNRLGVSRIELFHPARILGFGTVLIDTPGVGSTHRHNSAATLAFLAECDAAIFVLSADPPITQAEIEFLAEVRQHAQRLVFVLNKADYLSDPERKAALGFLRKVLLQEARIGAEAPIFPLSARRALQARIACDATLLEESGLPAIEAYLADTLDRERHTVLRQALAEKGKRALDVALSQIELELRALRLPMDDLERRLSEFDRALVEISRERIVAADLLSGDRSRALEKLEEDSAAIRREAREALVAELDTVFSNAGESDPAARARDVLSEAIPAFFEGKLAELGGAWQRQTAALFAPHQRQADQLIDSVRRAAAALFDMPQPVAEAAEAFESARSPYWITEQLATSLSPMGEGLFDRLMPTKARRMRQKRRLIGQIDAIVLRNVENLRWATRQNLEQVFHRFGARLDERLAEAIEATHGAILSAYKRRQDSAEQAAAEIGRLEQAMTALTDLHKEFARLAAAPSPEDTALAP